MELLLFILGIYASLALIGWIVNRLATVRENTAARFRERENGLKQQAALLGQRAVYLQEEAERLKSERASFEQYRATTEQDIAEYRSQTTKGIETLAKEKALGFPWLATAYSEYFELIDDRLASK